MLRIKYRYNVTLGPFQILNARTATVDELLAFDTGRQRQRETVRSAILNSSHNVYMFGSRGSDKTFFQKTQAHYFMAKAETKWDEGTAFSRGSLLPPEVNAIVAEFAEIIQRSNLQRIVVHLDEVELMGAQNSQNFYALCLEVFNPVGVQFVVTGTPMVKSDHESFAPPASRRICKTAKSSRSPNKSPGHEFARTTVLYDSTG